MSGPGTGPYPHMDDDELRARKDACLFGTVLASTALGFPAGINRANGDYVTALILVAMWAAIVAAAWISWRRADNELATRARSRHADQILKDAA